ncbi:hypothetical protein E2542_SST30092 [Spatholobus suberectus]|nr:hypothetical protein E2542_SST30092 [Spatholobus suberectus]
MRNRNELMVKVTKDKLQFIQLSDYQPKNVYQNDWISSTIIPLFFKNNARLFSFFFPLPPPLSPFLSDIYKRMLNAKFMGTVRTRITDFCGMFYIKEARS